MTNKDLFEALRTFEKEKGIPMDYMLQNIEKAISVACKNYYGGNENVVFKVDPEKNSFDAKLVKTVVDEVFDPNFEVTVEEAQQINKRKKFIVGDEIEVPIDPKHLGWTSVSSARNVIRQGIRQGEKGQTLIEFQSKLGEIVTATVERIDPKSGVATIKIGKSEATLPKSEQLGHDDLKEGDHIKVYIADVKDNERGPHAIISRTHPGLVKRLFEQEVPEIYDGVVEIKSISRDLWKDENDHSKGDWKDGVPLQPSYEQQDEIFQRFIERYPNLKCIARHVRYAHSGSENSLKAFMWYDGHTFESKLFTFNILDRVGGGDAFASGLIYAMLHNYKAMDMINFAVASSAIKHTIHGDANITDDVSTIRNLMNMNYDIKR